MERREEGEEERGEGRLGKGRTAGRVSLSVWLKCSSVSFSGLWRCACWDVCTFLSLMVLGTVTKKVMEGRQFRWKPGEADQRGRCDDGVSRCPAGQEASGREKLSNRGTGN